MNLKFLICIGATLGILHAQSPDTPIVSLDPKAIDQAAEEAIKKAVLILEKSKVLFKDEIDAQLLEPVPSPIQGLPLRTTPMSIEDLADHTLAANLRAGYCYKTEGNDKWQVQLHGGAYAIAEDIVVTCDHVLVDRAKMRDGFLMVVDHKGNVACASAILARSPLMDACIIRVTGAKLKAVPLNSNVRRGSAAYCTSSPYLQEGYFLSGMISRFFWRDDYAEQDPESLDALLYLKAELSTAWAPGSSGSPLFDQAGNAIGHVSAWGSSSTLSPFGDGKKHSSMIVYIAVPSKSVQRLTQTMDQPAELKRIATMGARVNVK